MTMSLGVPAGASRPNQELASKPGNGPASAIVGRSGTAALRWVVAAWCLAALAVLAKGLIGVVLPALIVAPWLLAQRRWRELLRLLHPLGLLAFAILALPWFVAMQQRYAGFFDYFIVEQHFRRFALMTFNNVRPAWFFVVMLPLVTLPWSAWLPLAWRERAAIGGSSSSSASSRCRARS
ncbi:MAG: phospholipid carrier-dependent glycosyltransferase [Betaproteobacteria bacterium]|nr:MAG: phospholipid carrier-dependent glycosyltransferase [Betaproteobacteria bacterium]